MFKFISDIENSENHFMVEWAYESGGRHWQSFDTESEMNKALHDNQAFNDAHKDEVDAIELNNNLCLIRCYETDLDTDRDYLMPYQVQLVEWYKKCVAENITITLDMYNNEMREITTRLNAEKKNSGSSL